MITIKRMDNGYMIISEEHACVVETNVEDLDTMNNAYTVQEVLLMVKEMLGEFGSKHDKYRLHVTVEKQNEC